MKKIALFLMLLIPILVVNAQKSRREIKAEKEAQLKEQTKKLIESKNFAFVPHLALPAIGRPISITSYSVKLKGDTVVSYLPFYGRAYTADYGSTSSPFDFSLKSEESKTNSNGENYEFFYQIKKESDNITYHFLIFENGSGTLNVNSTNRQSISFRGRIEEIKKE